MIEHGTGNVNYVSNAEMQDGLRVGQSRNGGFVL